MCWPTCSLRCCRTIFWALVIACCARSLSCFRNASFCSNAGRVEEVVEIGRICGVNPINSSKGVNPVVWLVQLLCTYCAMGSHLAPFSLLEVEDTLWYCFSHWVVPFCCP